LIHDFQKIWFFQCANIYTLHSHVCSLPSFLVGSEVTTRSGMGENHHNMYMHSYYYIGSFALVPSSCNELLKQFWFLH
jgi:hypothetical protein